MQIHTLAVRTLARARSLTSPPPSGRRDTGARNPGAEATAGAEGRPAESAAGFVGAVAMLIAFLAAAALA